MSGHYLTTCIFSVFLVCLRLLLSLLQPQTYPQTPLSGSSIHALIWHRMFLLPILVNYHKCDYSQTAPVSADDLISWCTRRFSMSARFCLHVCPLSFSFIPVWGWGGPKGQFSHMGFLTLVSFCHPQDLPPSHFLFPACLSPLYRCFWPTESQLSNIRWYCYMPGIISGSQNTGEIPFTKAVLE